MAKFMQPAEDGAEIHMQAALFQGHQVALLLWGVCPTGLGSWENTPSTLHPFISFSGCVSHLCLPELEVRSEVTAASICHLTHPGPGTISQVGGVKRGEVGPPLPAQV